MQYLSDIFQNEKKYFLQTYNRIPIEITHGNGVYLYGKDGKKYLDFFSGLAVNALGYGNDKVIKAIEEQIRKFIHLSNYYVNGPQVELAEKLVKYSGLSKVFYTNSGTEAVESSLKLIRKVAGPDKKIITFSNAFHGRTYGSLSLGGREKYKREFAPLLPNIVQLEYSNIEQLENNVDSNTAAIFIEFIQGEGGVRLASKQFVSKLNFLKSKFELILVADEIQSGIGRTGKPFAFNHFNIDPDLILVAKAIGGGLPLGAMITNSKYENVFKAGNHGSTFGGNPVACAAGQVVLNEVFENKLVENVATLGEYFMNQLKQIQLENLSIINEVRGYGFMIGVELNKPCSGIIEELRKNEILVNCTNDNVVRILPPLITKKENIDEFLDNFKSVIEK